MKNPSRQTIHNRIRKGWSKEEAENTPTDPEFESKRRKSRLWGMPRGKGRIFKLPQEWDSIMDEEIAASGLTTSDWIAERLGEFLHLLDHSDS